MTKSYSGFSYLDLKLVRKKIFSISGECFLKADDTIYVKFDFLNMVTYFSFAIMKYTSDLFYSGHSNRKKALASLVCYIQKNKHHEVQVEMWLTIVKMASIMYIKFQTLCI